MLRVALYRLRERLPHRLRRVLARTPVVGSTARRLDPLRDPAYVFTLRGALDGARFQVFEPSEHQYVTALYEPGVATAIESALRPGMACVDAGAHIGYMTLLMSRAIGAEGRVFAFEPNPVNCERLRQNLALNHVTNVTIVQAFVAAHDGSARLRHGPSSFQHRLEPAEGGPGATPTVALGSYLSDTTVGFVKLDVEGADDLAVDGMRRILERDRPTILIEDHGGPTEKARSILTSFGYRLTAVDHRHEMAVPRERTNS